MSLPQELESTEIKIPITRLYNLMFYATQYHNSTIPQLEKKIKELEAEIKKLNEKKK